MSQALRAQRRTESVEDSRDRYRHSNVLVQMSERFSVEVNRLKTAQLTELSHLAVVPCAHVGLGRFWFGENLTRTNHSEACNAATHLKQTLMSPKPLNLA